MHNHRGDAFNLKIVARHQTVLAHGLLGVAVKDVHVRHIEDNLHLVVDMVAGARINAGDEAVIAGFQIDKDFIAHQLGHIHDAFHCLGIDAGGCKVRVMNVLGADAKDNILANIRLENSGTIIRDAYSEGTAIHI